MPQELGVPRTTDFNGGNQEGVGYFQLFTRNGWRNSRRWPISSRRAGRQNLRVETDAQATGLILEGPSGGPALSPARRHA